MGFTKYPQTFQKSIFWGPKKRKLRNLPRRIFRKKTGTKMIISHLPIPK